MKNNIIDFLNKYCGTHIQKKRKKKYEARKNFLTLVTFLVGFVFVVIICSAFTQKTSIKISNNSSPLVTQNSELTKVSSEYNPKSGLIVSQFYIGNPKKMSDVSDDVNLANLKYKVSYKSFKGNYKAYKTKFIRINDHYFVVETTGVNPDFKILRYDIEPEKIDKALSTNYTKDNLIKIYVQESQVEKRNSLFAVNKDMYQDDYTTYIVSRYEKEIKHKSQEIVQANKVKTADEKLINKLQSRLDNAVNEDKEQIQSEIDDTKSDITQQKLNIKAAKKEIKKLEDRIDNVQMNQGDSD